MATSINFGTQQSFGFDPRTIAGCQIWLDAADSNTVSFGSGSNISTWRNKATGTNATATGSVPLVQNAINNLPALSFTSSIANYLTGAASITGTTALSIFAVATQTTGGVGSPRIIGLSAPNTDDYTSAAYCLVFRSGANTISGYRNNTTLGSVAGVLPSAPFLVSSIFNSANYTQYIYTPQVPGTSASTGSTGTFAISSYAIGINPNTTDTGSPWNGYIAEVIVFNTNLTTNQRYQVEGYLAWKWGLAYSAPLTSISTPLSISGCALWLDAADTSTDSMTLAGSNVSTWKDKSGSGNTTTSATGPPVLSNSAINGLPAIRTQTGKYFAIEPLSNVANQTTLSVFIVAIMSNVNAYGRLLSAGRTADGTSNNDFATTPNFVVARNSTAQAIAIYRGSPAGTPSSSMSITYGSPFLVECIFDGTNGNSFMNGTSNTTFSSTGTFSFNRLGIGYNINTKTDPTDVFDGLVGEVVVYYTALSSTQRQQVEGYLAKKWGLASSLPATNPFSTLFNLYQLPSGHSFRTNPTSLRVFQPIDISGCQLWFDGADMSTITPTNPSEGTAISQWDDKSGNGYHATQSTSGNRPTYSLTSRNINFTRTSSQFFNLPDNALPSGNSSYSYFLVVTFASTVDGLGIIGGGNFGTNNQAFGIRSVGTNANIIQFWWNVDLETTSGGVYTVNSPLLINSRYAAGGTRSILRNGIELVSNTPAARAQTTTNNAIGRTTPSLSEFFNGTISEIIVFNRDLTAIERQQMEGYLVWKWSLSPTSIASPLGISGCQLWFDAADTTTITPANPTNGTAISQWNDKSGNGYHASQSTVGNRPTYNAIFNTINFTRTSSQFFTLPDNALPSGNSSYSYFMVVTFASTVDGLGIIGGGNFGTTNQAFGIRSINTSGAIIQFWWNVDLTTGTGAYTVNVPLLINSRYAAGGTRSILKNGTQLVADAPAARAQTTTNNAIGRTTPANSEFFNGTISEIIVFNRDLTTTERQQIERYLAIKWRLGSFLPISQPFLQQVLPSTPVFVPTALSGLSLWLDAADSTTITGTTNVTLWKDKSGNGRNATATTGPAVSTYNGLPVLSFNGTSQSLANSTTVPTNTHTLIAIHVPTSITDNFKGNTSLFRFQTGGTNYIVFPFMHGTIPRGYISTYGGSGAGSLDYQNSTLVENSVTTNFNIIVAAIASGNQLIFKNGTQQTSNTKTLSSATSDALSIGTILNTEFYQGSVGEMIVFNRQLSTSERQQVEGYLAWKWGLQTSLPTTHPYYKFRP